MTPEEKEVAKESTLQLIRAAVRSRNLRRLNEAFQKPWAQAVIRGTGEQTPSGVYKIFYHALKPMKKEERTKAFQWTWDCYHPLMSDLGKVIQELDGKQPTRL